MQTSTLLALLFAAIAAGTAWFLSGTFVKSAQTYRKKFEQSAEANLGSMFLFIEPERLFIVNLALIALTFVVVYLFSRNVVVAILLALAIGSSPPFIYRFLQNQRRTQAISQLPDTLMAISGSMKAGASLNQALEYVVAEEKGPLAQEMELFLKEVRVGVDFAEALTNLYDRIPEVEMQLVVAGMKISREIGGNLSETLERISHTLRSKIQMEGKIKSLTAQGRLQGIVMTALPIGLIIILRQMEPEAMSYMFTTWYGWAIVGVIVVMEIIGFFFIRKIVDIDV